MDPFYNNPHATVDKSVILENAEILHTYNEINNDHAPSLAETLELVKEYQQENDNRADHFNRFCNDLEKMIFTDEERAEFSNFDQSPLLFCFTNLCWSRINYSNALQYVAKTYKTHKLDEIIDCFPQIIDLWKKAKLLFIMSFHSRRAQVYLDKASATFHEIKEKESDIVSKIKLL